MLVIWSTVHKSLLFFTLIACSLLYCVLSLRIYNSVLFQIITVVLPFRFSFRNIRQKFLKILQIIFKSMYIFLFDPQLCLLCLFILKFCSITVKFPRAKFTSILFTTKNKWLSLVNTHLYFNWKLAKYKVSLKANKCPKWQLKQFPTPKNTYLNKK